MAAAVRSLSPRYLTEAVDAFHAALDAYPGHRVGHGRDPGWIDDHDEAVVEALLLAGWMPPGVETAHQAVAAFVRRP